MRRITICIVCLLLSSCAIKIDSVDPDYGICLAVEHVEMTSEIVGGEEVRGCYISLQALIPIYFFTTNCSKYHAGQKLKLDIMD